MSVEHAILDRGPLIIARWADLAAHGRECEQCSEVIDALALGHEAPPAERIESLCAEGQRFAGAWIVVCEQQRQDFRGWNRRNYGYAPPALPPDGHPSHPRWSPPQIKPGSRVLVCQKCLRPLTPRQIERGEQFHRSCSLSSR